MTTVVSVAQGGTGSNSAALARTALGVPPSAAYDQANTARDQANTAYAQANSAYSDANTRLSASGGTLAGDLIITGNLTVSGNSTTLNAEILTIEDADVVLLSNVASTPALNAGIIVNRGTSTNTFLRWDEVTDKWGWSDDGSTTYKFNSALDAYAQANSAYGAANNRVLKAGDTMTGQLNISAGGLLVTGNVGVGMANPTHKLSVYGTVSETNPVFGLLSGKSSTTFNDGAQIAFGYNGSAQYMHFVHTRHNSSPVNNSIDFYVSNGTQFNSPTSGSTHVMSLNGGNVGIGTTNPATTLHVDASGGGIVRVSRLGTGAGIMQMEADGTDGALSTTNNLRFQTASTERMRITLGGDLLVGATNADIGGSVPGIKLMGATGKILASTNTASGLFYDEPIYADRMDASGDGVCIALARNGFYKAGIGVIRGASASAQGSITIYTATNSGFNERMRIDSSGNVGVGTTSPGSKLSVRGTTDLGDSHDSTTSSLHTTRLSGYALRYDASNRYGNYGVLIFSASHGWTSSAKRFMITNGIDANKFCIIRSVDGLTDPTLGDAGSITSGTADFTISHTGNIGIGESTPSFKLDVKGAGGSNGEAYRNVLIFDTNTAAAGVGGGIAFGGYYSGTSSLINDFAGIQGFKENGTAGDYAGALKFTTRTNGNTPLERMRISSGGNVGIGTTSPYSSLHLAGDLTMGSGSNARPALKITNWGYSASYRALLIGSSNTTYTTANTGAVTVCFNYDPSANPNGSFSGDGREIIFRRGTRFVTPNSADNAFNLTNLVLYDGNVGIGTDNPSQKLHVVGNILANGCPVQVQYTSSGTRTTVDSTSFVEPSTSYRVAITPKSTSSMIRLRFFIPTNADGASNTIYTLRLFRIISGTTSYALTSAGSSNGSRNVIAGSTFRPLNGYDGNDPMPMIIDAVDFPNTTSTCTYGFEFKRETGGGGTVHFGKSNGDNSNWGFDADILIIAEEIGQ